MAQNYNVQIVGKFVDKISGPMSLVKTGIGALVAGIAAIGGASLKTGSEMEQLSARLETATGSAESAAQAMDFITELTKQIPGNIEDTTNAFIQLTNLGLSPTEEAIKSYANTAAAMGKPLSQFVEAVADATTNEFERLKEFGIKTKTVGDDVQFTFQGMTTTVGKNSKEIRDYLEGLGNVQFAGAAEKQLNTLSGVMSNVGVEIQGILQDINKQNGLVEFAKAGAKQFIELVKVARTKVGPVFTFLKDQGMVFFDIWKAGAEGIIGLFQGIGQIVANVINSVFGDSATSSIVSFFTNWRQRILDVQLLFIGLQKGIADVMDRIEFFINAAAISLISGFKKLPNTFHQFVFSVANFAIEGINTMIRTALGGVNKIIDAVNMIPGVDIDPINIDDKTIAKLQTVKDTVDDVAFEMLQEETDKLNASLKENAEKYDEIADKAIDARYKEYEATQNVVEANTDYNTVLKKQREENDKNIQQSQEAIEANEKLIETLDEIRDKSQGVLSTFFEDVAKGSKDAFSDLVDNFRNAINQMIAQALASNIVRTLFGESGGSSNSGIANSFASFLGFEHGGTYRAHQPMIVGEKRPEIMVPETAGRIMPSIEGMGSTNVNVSINAIDRKSFTDHIDDFKFEIAAAVNDTRRYNYRGAR